MSECQPPHYPTWRCPCTSPESTFCDECKNGHMQTPGSHLPVAISIPAPQKVIARPPVPVPRSTGLGDYFRSHQTEFMDLLNSNEEEFSDVRRELDDLQRQVRENEEEIRALRARAQRPGSIEAPQVVPNLQELERSLKELMDVRRSEPVAVVPQRAPPVPQPEPRRQVEAVVMPDISVDFAEVADQLKVNLSEFAAKATSHLCGVIPLLTKARQHLDWNSCEALRVLVTSPEDSQLSADLRLHLGFVCVRLAEKSRIRSLVPTISAFVTLCSTDTSHGKQLLTQLEAICDRMSEDESGAQVVAGLVHLAGSQSASFLSIIQSLSAQIHSLTPSEASRLGLSLLQ